MNPKADNPHNPHDIHHSNRRVQMMKQASNVHGIGKSSVQGWVHKGHAKAQVLTMNDAVASPRGRPGLKEDIFIT